MKQFEVKLPDGDLIEGLSGQDVIELAKSGRLTGDSMIRQQGQEGWRLVRSVPRLTDHTSAVGSIGPSSTTSLPSLPSSHASEMAVPAQAVHRFARSARPTPVVAGVAVLLVAGIAAGLLVVAGVFSGEGRVAASRSDASAHRHPVVAAERVSTDEATVGAGKGSGGVGSAPSQGSDPIRDAYLDSAAKHAAAARAYKDYFDAWRGDAANEARIAYEYAARCAQDAADDPGRRGLADRAAVEAGNANFVALSNAHRMAEQDHATRAGLAGVVAGEAWKHTRRLTRRDI